VTRLDLVVLGQPRLLVDGEPSALSGRPVVALARLALSRVPVGAERPRDDVWPNDTGTLGNVQVTLSRLRSTVGSSTISRTAAGYSVSGVSVDAQQFEDLLAIGRQPHTHSDARLEAYDHALALWTGSAFEGVRAGLWFDAEAHRLDDLRQGAIDERFDLMLAMGRERQALDGLRAALAMAPAREPRAALLMLALYRCGLQREALNVCGQLRQELREQYGLNPGPAIAELERRILQHDPQLQRPTTGAPATDAGEVEATLRAAEALLRTGAATDAARLLEDAAARATNDDPLLMARLDVARARALMMAGSGDPAPLLESARAVARQRRDGRLLAATALASFGSGVPLSVDGALVSFLEPLPLLAPNAPEAVELLCCAAAAITFGNASDTADRLLDEAERVHARQQTARSDALVRVARVLHSAVRGESVELIAAESAAVWTAAVATGDPVITVMAAQSLLRPAYHRGDLASVDSVLPDLQQASRVAALPFGTVRVALCNTTNAIARGELHRAATLLDEEIALCVRLRTAAGPAAIRLHQLLLLLEHDRLGDMLAPAGAGSKSRGGPSSWDAVLALAGDDDAATRLSAIADAVPRDDSFDTFVALAAEVAEHRGDARLAQWCLPHLDALGDGTAMLGIGTCVLGFAHHFAGLAHLALGELPRARARLERASALAGHRGASLWWAHSQVALARVLAMEGRRQEAAAVLKQVRRTDLTAQSARLARLFREARALAAPKTSPR
jgi:DNA-binding SARP family transcriptional activator